MALLDPACLVPVSCNQLQLGMYVAELDRSWLQTSFHAHGFLLNQSEQIEDLRRICAYVYVDPALSEQSNSDGDMFYTGLTGRVEALSPDNLPTPLARQRTELRALGHAFAAAVQGVRRSKELVLTPLRRALDPVDGVVVTTVAPAPQGDMAELLRHLLTEYAATGLPPAYLPTAESLPQKDPPLSSTPAPNPAPNRPDPQPEVRAEKEDRQS